MSAKVHQQHPMSGQPNVADYIVRRLARVGINDCFGVAGDFAFKLDDAVARSEAIRWIGCSNELDAADVADGHAREAVEGADVIIDAGGVSFNDINTSPCRVIRGNA
jgi:TPP-dependent 2-oxoacid decarboxylase